MPLGVFGLTVALRLVHLRRAYDVFLDESTYSRISAGAAVDGRLVFGSFPFYLHGPLSFYLQAFWIHVFNITGTAIDVIYGLRVFNVLIAGFVAVLVFAIVRSVGSRRAGLLAAALFAFDPFIVSFDSRLFLETLATLWVALGFYLLLPLAGAAPRRSSRVPLSGDEPRRSSRVPLRALAGGFAFGLALLTKETSAPLYVLPLVWCVVRGRPLRRSTSATALVTAAVTYLPYPLVVIATGGASQFSQQKFGGIERMLGLVQTTGFNRPGAPSLLSRVSADLGTFLMTYVLIGLGAIAAVWLYRRGNPRQRLVATWGLAGLVMLAFQTTKGTIEEQMFYYLVVPSIVTVACAVSLASVNLRASRPRVAIVLLAFTAIGAFDLAAWVGAHTRHDTAIVRAVGWMQSHAPAHTRVAPLADGIQLLLPDYVLLFNPEAGDVSPAQLRAAGTQLVVTSSLQAEQGYSAASTELLAWLRLHAHRRFAATGASTGTVVIWQLGGPLPRSAPPGPQPLDPRAPLSIGAPTYHG
jgi:4-amino-4-deoxy-L-arabinose transferase-like glycosyltransferase